ncbi:MAG: 2-isopropylmalate synthase [Deltaproteobacteria bacterium]|nr:2-isopropylmalate synthase [Deltaproteobacteria bacterium]
MFEEGPDPLHDNTVYDWNLVEPTVRFRRKHVELLDETLRDGLQSAYLVNPPVEEKAELLRLMDALGIETADIGLPGASDTATAECIHLAKAIRDEGLRIRPAVAVRTLEDDVANAARVSQAAGMPLEVMAFIGSSPIRMIAEEWDLPLMLGRARMAIQFARREGLPVTFVTEDTIRSRPDILYRLIENAIDAGATRLCLTDTVGHATPDGIRSLLRFVWNLLKGMGARVGVDWHGHNDRGIALSNSLWALQWGADRVHGCALGVGERSGNCSIDRLIMNLRLLGTIGEDRDVSHLLDYCHCASRILKYPIPPNYPLAGSDAFRTQTGVHAAAILKARRKGDSYLADRIYSGVPAGMFGRTQEVCIGPMSGASNVVQYLADRGIDPTPQQVAAVLSRAKSGNHILSDSEVMEALGPAAPQAPDA